MIRLHQFAPAWDIPNLSPFCVKVETYLRMAGLPYETVAAFPPQGPKGKLPFIEDGGRRIGDSRLILDYLKQTYGDPLDGVLTPAERAVASAMQRLIEDDLFWGLVYARFGKRDRNWAETRRATFGRLPPVIRSIVPQFARWQMRSRLRGHGMGGHTEAEIYQLGRQDLGALADFLGEKPWFMGAAPTSLDASAYGLLVNILWCPIESPLKERVRVLPNLVAFCERLRERYYADQPVRTATQ